MTAPSLNCLGRFELFSTDGAKIDIGSEKHKLILAVLALSNGHRANRTELMSVLWGDRGHDQARGSLRHALWAIRKALGELGDQVLEANGQTLALRNLTIDVADFEAAIDEGTSEAHETALALYRGDLLEDIDLGGRDGYERLLIERERLRSVAVTAGTRLVDAKLKEAGPDNAAAVAQTVLAIDPLQENLHRRLIEIYRDSGQTGLAMKQYQTCREVLGELGVTPAEETEVLRRSLKASASTGDRAVPAAQPTRDKVGQRRSGAAVQSRRIWAGFITAVLAVAVIGAGIVFTGAKDRREAKPHIAVLPFQDMSIDNQQELYAEGLTADIITDLAKLSGIEVIARDSVHSIGGTDASILEIGDALGVGFVLRGNVRRSRGLVRINVQLINAETGRHLWADRFDRDTAEIFKVQDDVVRQVVIALGVDVSDTERAAVARIPTDNLEAYDHFLRAEHLALDTAGTENRQKKLKAYRKALELDPDFAKAYAGYARALVDIWRFDMTDVMSSTVAKAEAYQAANTALRLDAASANALAALSTIQLSDGQHGAAVASARSAVALEPGNAVVQADLALVLALTGQPEAARETLAIAHELNPAMPNDLLITSGIVAFEGGRDGEALEFLERALEREPYREWANVIALAAYGNLGNLGAAKKTQERLLKAFPIANLSYYRIAREQLRTPMNSERFIKGLELAGLPEWPYGTEPDAGKLVSAAALDELVFGRTWVGFRASGTPFIQENGRNGGFAYRSELSMRTGSIAVDGGRICETSDGNIPAGKSCGWLHLSEQDDADYLLLMPDSVRYFRVSK